MIQVWRICKPKFANSAFSGEGAAQFPGRWNLKNQKVVYTSDSPSLAILEILIHSTPSLVRTFKLLPCTFDDQLVEVLDSSRLPSNWSRLVDPIWEPLQQLGGEWIRSVRSAVLRVPTALAPHQWNYLLNPEHPDFKKISFGAPLEFELDSRFR